MRRLLIGPLFAAAGVFITPAAAWAHAELLSSDPGYGDRLPSAPAQVRLEFSGAMDLTGARLTLQRRGGTATALDHATLASPDPQAVVRFVDYASLAILIGGGFFLALVWTDGTRERRAQQLLWWALLASAVATLLTFGLTAAGLRGVGALDALRPSVLGAVLGTRFSRIITARAVFLALGFAALAMLTLGRDRAVRSRWWQGLAGVAAGGVLVTHALLGHASSEGLLARLAVLVHLVGVAVWLGGLVFLAAVVLPRRRSEEIRVLLPRFSSLAFTAVATMVVAGAVMVTRVLPKLSALPHTGYGRILLIKL